MKKIRIEFRMQNGYKDGFLYKPLIQGVPGLRTLKNFLATAMMPVGTTLYVYGGGWDPTDAGADMAARSIGVSEDWVRFFRSQDETYDFRNTADHPSGLDCSGFLGWTLYNVMNTENGNSGYVVKSTELAWTLAKNGWGTWTGGEGQSQDDKLHQFLPGDVISIYGHVWICLGCCADGSILVLHSTAAPSRSGQPGGGVELSALGADRGCDAYQLADIYMSRYYPQWYERYPVAWKDMLQYTSSSYPHTGRFSWNLTGENGGLTDPDKYRSMTAQEILSDLFVIGRFCLSERPLPQEAPFDTEVHFATLK